MTTEPTHEQTQAVMAEFQQYPGTQWMMAEEILNLRTAVEAYERTLRKANWSAAEEIARQAREIVQLRAAIARHREVARHYAAAGIEPFFFDYDLWEHIEEAE